MNRKIKIYLRRSRYTVKWFKIKLGLLKTMCVSETLKIVQTASDSMLSNFLPLGSSKGRWVLLLKRPLWKLKKKYKMRHIHISKSLKVKEQPRRS